MAKVRTEHRVLVEHLIDMGICGDQAYWFARGGYTPQPKQGEFHKACRACDEPGGPTQIGFGGARGPGKSHALFAQMALDDCQRQDELKCLLLRKVGKAVREHVEELRLKVLPHVPHEYRRSEGTLVFPNGSRIILGHFKDEGDVDAYLGLEYGVIGVEEATTLSASKYKAIQTCNRTGKLKWRPRIYTTTNPGGVGHAWYKALFVKPYQAGKEFDTRFIPATIEDNVFINPEYRATLDGLTGWLKRAWRFGDWDISAGQFFTTWRADAHVLEDWKIGRVEGQPSNLPSFQPSNLPSFQPSNLPSFQPSNLPSFQSSTIPPNWRVWLAMDYGFTHYTVVLLFAQDGDGNVYVVDEHAERRWLPRRHAQAVRAMLARHAILEQRVETFVAGRDCFDARPGEEGSVAEQWAAAGFRLTAANDARISGAAEILGRLGDVEDKIAPTLFISRACGRLIECLPTLEHDSRHPEDVLKVNTDDDGVGGDDPYDALRYGVMVAAGDAVLDRLDQQLAARRLAAQLNAWRG